MTSKHIPGPWRVGSVTDILASNGYVVARLGDPIHMHNDVTDANARLIAAAPLLLAALRDLAEWFYSEDPLTPQESLSRATEAIRKAECGDA